MTSIMATMPSKRLTAEQALRHPWLTSSADENFSSEDEATPTAKQAEEEQSSRPRETSALSFDDAHTLVDDSSILYKQKSVERFNGTDEKSAATNGLPSNCLAEGLNQPNLTTLTEKPRISSNVRNAKVLTESVAKYPPIVGTWREEGRQSSPITRTKAGGKTSLTEVTANKDDDGKSTPGRLAAAGATAAKAEDNPLDPLKATKSAEGAFSDSILQFSTKDIKELLVKQQEEKERQKEIKLKILERLSEKLRLPTPIPEELLPCLAKDAPKQNEIEEQARRDAAQVTSHTYTDYAVIKPLEFKNREAVEAASSSPQAFPDAVGGRMQQPKVTYGERATKEHQSSYHQRTNKWLSGVHQPGDRHYA